MCMMCISQDCVKLLMERGGKIERKDNAGWMPRDHAVLQGFQDVANLLHLELKVGPL